ncbi:MAG: cupin domain-containing protein [Atribacterota bacterium]|nr:cupin domain-containing protein [Atribacterota bacterium]MDD4897026.1 cupin domain-containing protein [Atribacterota bacterium]MDD5638256.1 cupin domain-containing protein [Atribacterota bacterium]
MTKKVTVHEDEVQAIRRDPPRTSKILLTEHTVGATSMSMGVNYTDIGSMIPDGVHENQDEAMFLVQGRAKLVIEDQDEYVMEPNTAFFVKAGTKHRIENIGNIPFKIVWVYSPPLPAHLHLKDK